jgi:internalin A
VPELLARVVSAAGSLAALGLLSSNIPWTTVLITVALCSSPLAVVGVPSGVRRLGWGSAAVGGGAVAVLSGMVQTHRTGALDLLRLDFPLRQVAANAATELAPLWLIAVGVTLVLAGVAVRSGDRLLQGLTVAVTVLVSGSFAVALVGLSGRELLYRGGQFRAIPAVAAVIVVVAGGLLVVVVRSRWSAAYRGVEAGGGIGAGIEGGAGRPSPVASSGWRRPIRWVTLAVVLALAGSAAAGVYRWAAPTVETVQLFPDPALAACVARAAGDSASQPVSQRELTSVFSLNCNGDLAGAGLRTGLRTGTGASTGGGAEAGAGRIRSLQGLEHLNHLTSADFSNNDLTDLTPLAAVPTLTHLKLTHNRVSTLAPLAELPRLTELGLSGNTITDLGPLGRLTSLHQLGLAENTVASVQPLAGLSTLTELDLTGNRISSVQGLAGLTQLDRLTLSRNRIRDARPLASLPALTMLNISDNRLASTAGVDACPAVDELWIGGNRFTDVAGLAAMPALRGVDLSNTDPTRVTGVEVLRKRGIYVGGLA